MYLFCNTLYSLVYSGILFLLSPDFVLRHHSHSIKQFQTNGAFALTNFKENTKSPTRLMKVFHCSAWITYIYNLTLISDVQRIVRELNNLKQNK